MADNVVYVNIEEGTKRVMNNAKIFAKLLSKFKNDTSFNELDTAMENGDIENAKINVHTLKGLAANLSLTELFKQSVEMETQLKMNSVNPQQIIIIKDVYKNTIIEMDKVIAQYA